MEALHVAKDWIILLMPVFSAKNVLLIGILTIIVDDNKNVQRSRAKMDADYGLRISFQWLTMIKC